MSTPAQNPRPSARTTTTRTDGIEPAASTASAKANHDATSSALTGGTSMTTSAVPGERSCVSIPMDGSRSVGGDPSGSSSRPGP